jgi:phage gpG-like protein
MIAIEIKSDLSDFKNIDDDAKKGIYDGVRRAMIFAEGKAKRDFTKSRTSAGGLHVRTGAYRRGIKGSVRRVGDTIVGSISADVIYAGTHEFGPTIIRPKKGKWLRFPIDGQWKTVAQVIIPHRPVLKPAITENEREIAEIIVESTVREVTK